MLCACLYVCLPVKREKWKEWDSKLTKALKCPSSLKNLGVCSAFSEDFLFFNCCFFCCLQLQDQGGVPVCEDTPAPAAAQALHRLFALPRLVFSQLPLWSYRSRGVCAQNWGFCLLGVLLKVLQHRSGTGKVRVLGDLLQWRSVGIVETKSQR